MKRVFSLLLILALTLSLAACGNSNGWQEQYDLGQKYLTEGNYEEAILAFTAAIEIDPKRAPAYVGRGRAYIASGATEDNLAAAQADFETAIDLDDSLAEAYLGLAELYLAQGDYQQAQNALQSGWDRLDWNDSEMVEAFQRFQEELQEERLPGTAMWSTLAETMSGSYTGGPFLLSELSLLGQPLPGMDIYAIAGTLQAAGIRDRFSGGAPQVEQDSEGNCTVSTNGGYWVFQMNDGHYLSLVYESLDMDIEFRGIRTGDSLETVLSKLGIGSAAEAAERLRAITEYRFSSAEEATFAYQHQGSAIYTGDEATNTQGYLGWHGGNFRYEDDTGAGYWGTGYYGETGFTIDIYQGGEGSSWDVLWAIEFSFKDNILSRVEFRCSRGGSNG